MWRNSKLLRMEKEKSYCINLLFPCFSRLCLGFFHHHHFYSCLKLKPPFIVVLRFLTETTLFHWILRYTFHSLIQHLIQQLLTNISVKSLFSTRTHSCSAAANTEVLWMNGCSGIQKPIVSWQTTLMFIFNILETT